MFTVVNQNKSTEHLCECASYTNAHKIALALRSFTEPGFPADHFAVLRGDEMLFNTKDGRCNQ